MITHVGYSVVGWLVGRVMLCAVCTVHEETRNTCFWLNLKTKVDGLSVVWPQNHWDGLKVILPQNHRDGFSRFSLKIGGDSFFRFGLKTGDECFLVWGSKSTAIVWWFWSQNHRDDFLVCASKPSGLRFVGCVTKPMKNKDDTWVSKSSGLLSVEPSWTRGS
jgi:hypothetical protein